MFLFVVDLILILATINNLLDEFSSSSQTTTTSVDDPNVQESGGRFSHGSFSIRSARSLAHCDSFWNNFYCTIYLLLQIKVKTLMTKVHNWIGFITYQGHNIDMIQHTIIYTAVFLKFLFSAGRNYWVHTCWTILYWTILWISTTLYSLGCYFLGSVSLLY